MSGFRYSLQVALEHAFALERRAHEKVRALLHLQVVEQGGIAELEARAAAVRREFSVNGPAGASHFIDLEHRLHALGNARAERTRRLAVVASRLAASRTELRAFSRRLSALERHRARMYAEHQESERRCEAAELDELNILRRRSTS